MCNDTNKRTDSLILANRVRTIESMEIMLQDRFCKKLREALAEKGWSQSDLARATEMTPQSVGSYVHGRVCPGLNLIEKFEIALDLALGSLVDDQPIRMLEKAA